MCPNFGTPKNNFTFGINGKLFLLVVPILKHITVKKIIFYFQMEVDSKDTETPKSSSPVTVTTSAPPPLLKQAQTDTQKSQPRLLPQPQRTILQQPPPLIKPNTTTANKPPQASA